MKIDQSAPFSKPIPDTLPPASAKDNVNAQLSTARVPTVAGQGQSVVPTPQLSSTNGDFDAARVAQIREDIGAGRYKVNTDKIADGLLATVRDLIARKAQ
ncbi:MAG: flagellar biosynthesis anti-sigma factor FlgM [Rhodoferax sp.]